MLGFNELRQTVHEPFASQMRDALHRAQTGQMTEFERECEERLEAARNLYSFTWE